MLRELVSTNIFVFTSDLYAQVTAGVIITSGGAVVVDTMPFPAEARQIMQFIDERYGVPVRYVINTHYHADHTYGTCFFRGARVVAHRLCRDLLDTRGRAGLEQAQRSMRDLAAVEVRLPDLVFDEGVMSVHVGGVTLEMWHTPGHSMDSIACLVKEEGILFAADTMMPIPFFADGSWDAYVRTLEKLLEGHYECIVQGHGEVILRGEIRERLEEDLGYLHCIRSGVEKLVKAGKGPEALQRIDIEKCGKSRIALNGMVEGLHRANLEALYAHLMRERAASL
ncbi:MAG: hypothetical protein Kow00124_05810 [Anaerolineae bacterium]